MQDADPADVDQALEAFLARAGGFEGAEDETRLFLLMRFVFDLPEQAPEAERRSYKGWVNWPPPGPDGTVSLAWPLTFAAGGPALVDPYEGAEGPRYAAVAEYRHLLERYSFRGR